MRCEVGEQTVGAFAKDSQRSLPRSFFLFFSLVALTVFRGAQSQKDSPLTRALHRVARETF